MPIYEYYCKNCDIEFEKLVIGEETEIRCPKCGSKDVERVFSSFGKKSGWDFKTSSSRKRIGSYFSSEEE